MFNLIKIKLNGIKPRNCLIYLFIYLFIYLLQRENMEPTVTLRVNGLIATVKWKVIGLMTFFPITSQDHLYGVSGYITKIAFLRTYFQ